MLSRYKRISTCYNNLYTTREDVWNERAGRGPHFTAYLAALIQELKPRCYIDIGSGEGALLGTVSAPSKVGVEISRSVIKNRTSTEHGKLLPGYCGATTVPHWAFQRCVHRGCYGALCGRHRRHERNLPGLARWRSLRGSALYCDAVPRAGTAKNRRVCLPQIPTRCHDSLAGGETQALAARTKCESGSAGGVSITQ